MGPPTFFFGWFSSGSFLIQGNRFGRIWDFSVFEFDGKTNALFTEVLLGTRRTRAHTERQKIFLGKDFILSIKRHFRSSTNNCQNPNPPTTQHNITEVGFDMKMTLHHHLKFRLVHSS